MTTISVKLNAIKDIVKKLFPTQTESDSNMINHHMSVSSASATKCLPTWITHFFTALILLQQDDICNSETLNHLSTKVLFMCLVPPWVVLDSSLIKQQIFKVLHYAKEKHRLVSSTYLLFPANKISGAAVTVSKAHTTVINLVKKTKCT